MKPTTPIDTEMVFLRDVEWRLDEIYQKALVGEVNLRGILGLRGVLTHRIAVVRELRDKENAICQNAKSPNAKN